MIKIIKYSITFIIFSIIASLFVLYFYLLKGIEIKNINYKHINVGKLYIKIDKKIVFDIKNIYINSENSNINAKTEIDFKQIKTITDKILKYSSFVQHIKIENLNVNNTKIKYIFFKDNRLIFENKDLYIKSSLHNNGKNVVISTDLVKLKDYNIELKKYNTNIKDISIVLHILPNQLEIIAHMFFNGANEDTKIIVTKNNFFYKGTIKNISKKTLDTYAKNLKFINNLSVSDITFKGDKNSVLFKINNIESIILNKFLLKTNLINGKFDFKAKKLRLFDKNIKLLSEKNNIEFLNTHFYYYVDTQNGYIKNDKILVFSPDLNASVIRNKVICTPKITTIKLSKLDIKHKLGDINISSVKAQYLKNNLYGYIPKIKLEKNDTLGDIKDVTFKYNPKLTLVDIPFTKIAQNKYNTKLFNSDIKYQNNKVATNISKIFIDAYGIKGNIYKNYITYDINSKALQIENNNSKFDYLNIKNISLYNINTYYEDNMLITNINTAEVEKLKVNDIGIYFKNNLLKVIFHTKELLSTKLNKILSEFDINIPIYQKTGINKVKGKVSYDFNTSKVHTDIKIKTKSSKLILDKNSYLDVKYANIYLKDSLIMLKDSLVDYNQSIVNVDYFIRNGFIDLNNLNIQTKGRINDLNITDIIEIKNHPEDLYIDLNKIDILLKKLKVRVLVDKNIEVYINKLSKIYPYISYLKEYNINDGKVKVIIGDSIDIYTHISDTNQTILEQNLTPLTKLDINTTINNNVTNISNKNININILTENNNTIIYGGFKNLDLNITKFIDKNDTEDNKSLNIKTNITAKNTYILYNDLKLYSNKLLIQSNTQYNKTFAHIDSLYKDRNITLLFNDGELKLYGLKIKEKTFKDLTNTSFLKKPLLDLYVYKTKNSEILQGFVEIKKGYIKELKAFNNLLAFINLIPSLVTFQPAGFSSKGYKIQYGYIEFFILNNIIYLEKIKIKGENMTFDGAGYIDLNKKTMNINVKVNLLIKLVKDIPIVNYILLGKDGGITLNVDVKGPFDNPSIYKHSINNIISTPFDILKRALLTPFRPFMEDK